MSTNKNVVAKSSPAWIEKQFRLTENKTDIRTEIMAGITTFLTMVYIIFVNPDLLSIAGMPKEGVFIATILASIVGTAAMALMANYPFALAPGMGLNAFFAFSVASVVGWQGALALVFLEGILFIILSATNFRTLLINSIPMSLKAAISAGIGLFIALIGFSNSEIVVADPATFVALGDLSSPVAITAIFGLLVAAVLYALKVKGALLFSIIAATIFGMLPGIDVTGHFSGIMAIPSWDSFLSTAFKLDFSQAFKMGSIGLMLSLFMVDLFDTAGTLVGVSTQAGYLDEKGELPRSGSAFMADAIATVAGALFGTSTTTTFVESASGVAEGGRTGLTGIVICVLFVIALFFSPLVGLVPSAATAPALIVVGVLMMQNVLKIDWSDFTQAFPAFLTIVAMPFTYSIANGIGLGFISYAVINTVVKSKNKSNWIINVLAAIFAVYFIFI
ncbi:MAG TPA: NCS2 family permease [Natronincola sp.]|nr:NCS2 family permease [Natronincola sp.]